MAFERFVKQGRLVQPSVSVSKRGTIYFNRGAMEKHKLETFQYAILHYDGVTKQIGLKFTNNEKEKGVLSFHKSSGGKAVNATSFLSHYGIDHAETRRFDIRFDEKHDLFVIELSA